MKSKRQRTIGAGEFKAKCLQLMDEVNRQGIELIITKRGQPVAKLVPGGATQSAGHFRFHAWQRDHPRRHCVSRSGFMG